MKIHSLVKRLVAVAAENGEERQVGGDGVMVDADLVEVDHETSEVRIKDWFRENCPMNDSHRKGTLRIIAAIKSTTLKDATQVALNEAWGALVASRNPLDGRAGNISSAVLQSMAARRTGQRGRA